MRCYQTSYHAGDTRNFITKTTTYKVISVNKSSMMLPAAYQTSYQAGDTKHYQGYSLQVINVKENKYDVTIRISNKLSHLGY